MCGNSKDNTPPKLVECITIDSQLAGGSYFCGRVCFAYKKFQGGQPWSQSSKRKYEKSAGK